jgi:hypothetical protein
MSKIEQVIKRISDMRELYKHIRKYRFQPTAKRKHSPHRSLKSRKGIHA